MKSPTKSRRSGQSRRIRTLAILSIPLLAAPILASAPEDQARASSTTPGDSPASSPTNESPPSAELELDEPKTVTLITGDRVTMHPGGAVDVEAGPGRDHITFDQRDLDESMLVVPSDTAPLLDQGKLDQRLFDITYLLREGYDDTSRPELPLIIEGKADDVRDVATGPGSKVKRQSAKLKMSAVAQNKANDKGKLWSRLAGENETTPRKLSSGVDKVWLDGMAHVTLDESVPQIGAPEVWASGFTGEGVTVAVLDTGVDQRHPDLVGEVSAARAFSQTPGQGMFNVGDDAIGYLQLGDALDVPTQGSSDPLVYVGRACVDSEGDELLADPDGATALIARSQDVCGFAEKFDAVVEAGATGVVIFNDAPGLFRGRLAGAEHGDAAWGATISETAGEAITQQLEDDAEEVVLGFTNDPLLNDVFGHGTHVASTIVGSGAGSDGARKGVAPDAELLSGKVCDDRGQCQESWVIAGMEWAANAGADIVNMSLGGCCTDGTDPMSQAVNTLTEMHDVLFVASAGNLGAWGIWFVGAPAVADAALAVGAVDKDDQLAYFSSRGPRLADFAAKPEVTAPGVDIVAARATGTSLGNPLDDGLYTSMNGTSMAAPHVAGTAALLKQARPQLDALELKDAIASTTIDGGYSWHEQGSGRIDAARAVGQGVYANASVSFGELAENAEPVEKEITYTNNTNRPVALELGASLVSIGGKEVTGLSLSRKRLTIQPHENATVSVTVDPQDIDAGGGAYGGVVSATGKNVTLRTTIGLGLKQAIPRLAPNWAEDWTATYDYADGDWPGWYNGMRLKDSTASPDGKTLVLFGAQEDAGVGAKLTTAAIDAATGKELWVAHQPVSEVVTGSRNGSVTVSPDETTVFVVHDIWNTEANRRDSLLLAYNNTAPQDSDDPGLGELLWKATYQDMGLTRFHASHGAMRVAVTPDSDTVLMVATKAPSQSNREIHTVAYDAHDGEQTWSAVHARPGLKYYGRDIAIDPAGGLAYVTGFEEHEAGGVDVKPVTIAYALTGEAQGEKVWIARHDTVTANYGAWHNAVSDDGERVFVSTTVRAGDEPLDEQMQTIAYDARSGAKLWSKQFAGVDHGYGPGHTEPNRNSHGSITVSPTNDLVFITGKHAEGGLWTGRKATVVLAYNQRTGDLAWSQLEKVQESGTADGTDFLSSAAASADGERLYASGSIGPAQAKEQLTLAYDAVTGERIAVARHKYGRYQEGRQTFITPDGTMIFTVSSVVPEGAFEYWAVAAYPSPIHLTAHVSRSRGNWLVALSWTGAAANEIDVHRNGKLIATVDNTGSHTDDLGTGLKGTTVAYKVCAAGTANCSKDVTVTTGPQPRDKGHVSVSR